MISTPYDANFFASQRSGSLASALVVVPLVVDIFRPKRLIDVGCGIGTWASVAAKLGLEAVVGVDGDYVNKADLLIPPANFISADLNAADETTVAQKFDVAMCVEVAEHLKPDRSQSLTKFLTHLAPIVVFGAALPSQGGTAHINERWPTTWVDMFRQQNYRLLDIIRPRIWNDNRVAYWYRQNTLVFVNTNHKLFIDVGTEQVGPDIVHPELYARKSQLLDKALKRIRELESQAVNKTKVS